MEGFGMSKRDQRSSKLPNGQQRADAVVPPVVQPVIPEALEVVSTPTRDIADYRRCPLCWNGSGGYGCAYSTQGKTRYYKCCKTVDPEKVPCGHTWTATVLLETIKIEHKVVTLDGMR